MISWKLHPGAKHLGFNSQAQKQDEGAPSFFMFTFQRDGSKAFMKDILGV